jgi:hypothetical protein
MGAPATVVVPWSADRCDDGASNQEVAGSSADVMDPLRVDASDRELYLSTTKV